MQDKYALQSGTILDRYKIIRVLGEGGFGITYLAEDISLGLEVVIKEYFPNEFAMRIDGSTITTKSTSVDDFSKGIHRFKEEAQILAKFNHPSIVKILGYFEANDTAYFVMEYEEGIDLSQYLKQNGTPLSQEEILSIMMPILEGLKEVHFHNYLHRDIKPGNILLRKNKSPVLIDFGSSKLAMGEASKSITSMLTEGYAPLEQYSTDIKQQGPFTDLYAVAAVIYKMITGEVPPSAQTRSYAILSGSLDPCKSLELFAVPGFNKYFINTIDKALEINANKRPQTVQEMQKLLVGEAIEKKRKVEEFKSKEIPRRKVIKPTSYRKKPPSDRNELSAKDLKKRKTTLLMVFMLLMLIVFIGLKNSSTESPQNENESPFYSMQSDSDLVENAFKKREQKRREVLEEEKRRIKAKERSDEEELKIKEEQKKRDELEKKRAQEERELKQKRAEEEEKERKRKLKKDIDEMLKRLEKSGGRNSAHATSLNKRKYNEWLTKCGQTMNAALHFAKGNGVLSGKVSGTYNRGYFLETDDGVTFYVSGGPLHTYKERVDVIPVISKGEKIEVTVTDRVTGIQSESMVAKVRYYPPCK